MLVKNAERCLNEVLSSLSFVDEVVLLDNGSTDNTLAIAAQFSNVVV
ncbi:MAG: glycosyltransferase, partial [Kingella sp. (in: b-proteobacteria)]